MVTIAVWQSARCTAQDQQTFRAAAARVGGAESYAVSSVKDLNSLTQQLPRQSVDHLVIVGHGGPTWVLDSHVGLTTQNVGDFAGVWSRVLTREPKISLAACLCSRSPTWYLKQKWDYLGSDWGQRGYLPGGQASLAARIRDCLYFYGCLPEVRGHRTAGHATANPILARHDGLPGTPCMSWWGLNNPGKTPTLLERKKWVKEKQGVPSEKWLFFNEEE